jgi:hypothetical protein
MKNKKATNKQILQAHSQSIKYLKEAKRFDDEQKVKDTTSKKRGVMKFIISEYLMKDQNWKQYCNGWKKI